MRTLPITLLLKLDYLGKLRNTVLSHKILGADFLDAATAAIAEAPITQNANYGRIFRVVINTVLN